jgi:hypothetical protein
VSGQTEPDWSTLLPPDPDPAAWKRARRREAVRRALRAPILAVRRYRRWIVAVVVIGTCAALVFVATAPSSRGGGRRAPAAEPRADNPFADTPAAKFPDGVRGLVKPAVRPTGDWSAGDVSTALDTARKVLAAAYLDHTMVEHRDTSQYLDLLAPAAADADRERTARDPAALGKDAEVGMLPRGTHLQDSWPVKVNGVMTYGLGEQDELVVHANYLFVYAIQPTSIQARRLGPGGTTVILHVFSDIVFGPADDNGDPAAEAWVGPRVRMDKGSYLSRASCAAAAQGYLALPGPADADDALSGGSAKDWLLTQHGSGASSTSCHPLGS